MKKKNSPPAHWLIAIWITILVLMFIASSGDNDSPQKRAAPLPLALQELLQTKYAQYDCSIVWEERTRGEGVPRYFYVASCGVDDFRFAECHYYNNTLLCYPLEARH